MFGAKHELYGGKSTAQPLIVLGGATVPDADETANRASHAFFRHHQENDNCNRNARKPSDDNNMTLAMKKKQFTVTLTVVTELPCDAQ